MGGFVKVIPLNKSNIQPYKHLIPKEMRFCAARFLEVPRSYVEQVFSMPMDDLEDDLSQYQQVVLKIDDDFVVLELNDYPYLALDLKLADGTSPEQRKQLIEKVQSLLSLNPYWINDLSIVMK